MTLFICKYCNNPAKRNSNLSLIGHERLCKLNPDRKPSWLEKNLDKLPPSWNKGKTKELNPELAEKLSAGGLSFSNKVKLGWKPFIASDEYWTDERKEEKSLWRKQLHKNFPETHPNRRLAGNRNKMTYPEKVAFDFLVENNIQFEHQKQIDRYFVDFNINNIIIEIDGARWHDKEKDAIRDRELEKLGYTIFRIDTKEKIVDRIKNILGVV